MNTRLVPTTVATIACLLSTSALSRLFDGTAWWFVPVLIAVVVAVGTATAGRLLRLPTAAGLLLSLAGLLVVVTVLCARSTALFGVVPTSGTVRTLRELISAGSSDISRLATPVPHRPGVVVLTVTGIYLTAMLVDLIVVTLDRPTFGGLPLLALYAVSAAILPGGVGPVPFLLGAVSFIALLMLDGRLAFGRWGRTVSDGAERREGEAFGGRVTVNALGVALAALVVAVTVPMGVPSLDGEGLVSRKGGYGAGDGPSSASVVQPIVSVSQQLHASNEVPLLNVREDTPHYLRLTALENFDGQLFTLRALNATRDNRISEGLPKPRLGGGTVTTSASISVTSRFNELYLPVPGVPTRVRGLVGDWRLATPTGTIFSTRTSTSGAKYQVDAVVPNPTRQELQASSGPVPDELAVDTALPADLDPRLRQLVATVTRGARTPYEKIYAIQEYLRGPLFTYDLRGAPTTQEGALSEFLFDTRTGYCEQFASAMTVMVRMLGAAARVAIGFVPGERQADGSYLVTNRQAHAWPEVWFPNVGWVSFEPTRRADGATTAPSYAPAGVDDPDGAAASQGPELPATPQPDPAGGPVPVPSAAPTPSAAAGSSAPQAGKPASAAPGGLPMWVFALLVATPFLLLGLATPAIIRVRRRRARLRPGRHGPGAVAGGDPGGTSGDDQAGAVAQVHEAWAELLDVAADLGVTIRTSDSPRAGVARLTAYLDAEPPGADRPAARGAENDGPEAGGDGGASPTYQPVREAFGRLAAAEERARYAPPELASPPPPAEVARDVELVAGTLWSVAPRGRRIMARLVPPSVFRRGEPGAADAVTAVGTSRSTDRHRWLPVGGRRTSVDATNRPPSLYPPAEPRSTRLRHPGSQNGSSTGTHPDHARPALSQSGPRGSEP
ncbi:Transglutaminase-like enzyme, predicted cysteine protease [Frankia canadensis]|uniref:Transglutaminase-like enzyme, predicted cysteine protease n=1 Tax=Frankia canadensis TaxID=1836972 RepID=A0A2I2KTK9_9ACTN|nr:transglutaminaseTgpA domain-containing protein [Frankia canadensis]SNQ48997.1 Transglutaminase-like enzyme, predicted cysteine protease [Frankia canadensis]SOU56287.1 Transglutaminase-like enzyme, predicted cysteine protease [Frankia canadensis]